MINDNDDNNNNNNNNNNNKTTGKKGSIFAQETGFSSLSTN